jgi:tetratricopeptide (TPR) repeat protein
MLMMGIAMVLRPLSVIADVVPLVGNMVGTGTGILSFLIAAPFAFLTVAVAWLRYRPVIGISLLVGSGVVAGLIFFLSKQGKKSRKSTPDSLNPREMQTPRTPAPKTAAPKSRPKAGNAPTPPAPGAAQSQEYAADMLKKGQSFFYTGQYDKAIVQFSRAIKSGGDRKLALYNRGVALFKIDKKEAALKDFKHAAKLGHKKAKAVINQIKPDTA